MPTSAHVEVGFFLPWKHERPMQPPFDIPADLDTPVSAYMKLREFEPRFLLESVEGGQVGRYSFIGLGARTHLVLTNEAFTRDGEVQAYPSNSAGLLDTLRDALKDTPKLSPEIPGVPFAGGLVGVAGYDLVRFFENLPVPKTETPTPLAALLAPTSVLVFDHLTRRAALLHSGSHRETLRRDIVNALRGPLPWAPHRPGRLFETPTASMSQADFFAAVEKAQQHIRAGDIFQIVLSICFSGQTNLAPFEVYRALRLLNPSPYMFFFDNGQLQVAGSSPEALVKLDQGLASLRPIAGTRPRGESSEQDLELERELLADPKENAEHIMLVDLARNDLGRVATAGSVTVDPFKTIEKYSHVMHMVSGVTGRLTPDRDAFDLFQAAFPAGTLVGAPKVRAMELIAEMEVQSRSIYAGTVGYFDNNGNMDQAIAIRTLVFHDGQYSFQAGAGIVADSIPEAEYAEVSAKSAVLRRALEMAEEGL